MPYGIRKSGEKFKVVNKETGRVFGTHSTKEKAKKQLAALYIHAHPKNEETMLDVRVLINGKAVNAQPIRVLEEAVRKDVLMRAFDTLQQKAAGLEGIAPVASFKEPNDIIEFIKSVDTSDEMPHGNWICMALAKGMPTDERTKSQLKTMLAIFVRFKKQVAAADHSINIYDYANYNEFRDMIFSFSKAAYDFDPESLPHVKKVYDQGAYAAYQITAPSSRPYDIDEVRSALESLAVMGNGTKWCTRKEWNPQLTNAMNYLVNGNPDRTMFIITKFNAPYVQLQKNLSSVMDVTDTPITDQKSKLYKTYELADVFARIAPLLNLNGQYAKEKLIDIVGVRTRKSFEYHLSQGIDESTLLKKLSKPLSSIGFNEEETYQIYLKAFGQYNAQQVTLDLNWNTTKDLAYSKEMVEYLLKAGPDNAGNFGIIYTKLLADDVQQGKLEREKVLPLEPFVDQITKENAGISKTTPSSKFDANSYDKAAGLVFIWCVFVRESRWPEKEALLEDMFRKRPDLNQIYDQLSGKEPEEDFSERPEELFVYKSMILNIEKHIRSGSYSEWQTRATAVELRELISMYGRLPSFEEYLEKKIEDTGTFGSRLQAEHQLTVINAIKSIYVHQLNEFNIEEVE